MGDEPQQGVNVIEMRGYDGTPPLIAALCCLPHQSEACQVMERRPRVGKSWIVGVLLMFNAQPIRTVISRRWCGRERTPVPP